MTAGAVDFVAWKAAHADPAGALAEALRERFRLIYELRLRQVMVPDLEAARKFGELADQATEDLAETLVGLRSLRPEDPCWWEVTGLAFAELAPWLLEFGMVGDGSA